MSAPRLDDGDEELGSVLAPCVSMRANPTMSPSWTAASRSPGSPEPRRRIRDGSGLAEPAPRSPNQRRLVAQGVAEAGDRTIEAGVRGAATMNGRSVYMHRWSQEGVTPTFRLCERSPAVVRGATGSVR